jgi:hypothetical protein
MRFHDPYCAFKLFRREVIERIEFQSNSRFILVELLAKATFLGHLMDEVAICLNPGPIPSKAEPDIAKELVRKDRRDVFFKHKFVTRVPVTSSPVVAVTSLTPEPPATAP